LHQDPLLNLCLGDVKSQLAPGARPGGLFCSPHPRIFCADMFTAEAASMSSHPRFFRPPLPFFFRSWANTIPRAFCLMAVVSASSSRRQAPKERPPIVIGEGAPGSRVERRLSRNPPDLAAAPGTRSPPPPVGGSERIWRRADDITKSRKRHFRAAERRPFFRIPPSRITL